MAAAASKPQPVNNSRYLKNNIAMPPKIPLNPVLSLCGFNRRGRSSGCYLDFAGCRGGQGDGWLYCGWWGENLGDHRIAFAPDHDCVTHLHQRIKLFHILLAHTEAAMR